jgi:NodT family efflux transporter outer membrane factor (OMF) lipoprotein
LGIAAAVTGCSVGPDYEHPQTTTPDHWDAQPESPEPDQTQAAIASDWWKSFRHSDLDQLIAHAQAGSFDLAAAVARVHQADAQLRIASAPLLPAVGLSAGASRAGSQVTSIGKGVSYNTYNLILGASYELDFWGKNADAAQAAQANLDATRFNRQTTLLTLNASVATTYFTILSLTDRINVAQHNLTNAQNTLEAFQARMSVGLASALDIAQQESIVAEQRAALPPLTQALRQNIYALAVLAGRLPETLAFDSQSLDAITLPDVNPGLPSSLLARRPDVQRSEAMLISANASIKQAIASVFPSIVLTAQGGVESGALNTLLQPGGLLYSLGASLTQPIFKGEALQGGIDLARAQYDELLTDYRKTVIAAFQDVESSLVTVDMTAKQEKAQRFAVDTAMTAYQITQEQLKSGTADILTVLNVQRTLFQSQDQLLQTRLAHLTAIVGLYRSLGGGWSVKTPDTPPVATEQP